MKKIILTILALMMIFCLTSCNKEKTLMKNAWEYGGAIYSFEEEGVLKMYAKGVESTGTWSLSEEEELSFSVNNVAGKCSFDFEKKTMILKKPNGETVEWKVYAGDVKKLPKTPAPGEIVPTIE